MKRLTLWTAAFALVLSPMAAMADEDVDSKMRAMEARMSDLENKLDSAADNLEAANVRLEAQQEVLDTVEVDASSGLSSFLDTIEIGGWVAGSYMYAFGDTPDGRFQPGYLGGDSFGANPASPAGLIGARNPWAYPYHPDANTFSLDQFWMEIERAVSEENRAGFRADLVYGKAGGILSGNANDFQSGSSNDFNLYQAYVQYLAPLGNGIHFKAGKFQTLIGAEVVPTAYNYNITRGNVFNLLQPINHTGILAGYDFGPVEVQFGAANETYSNTDTDANKNKALMGSIGGSGEVFGWQLAGIYGDAQSSSITTAGCATAAAAGLPAPGCNRPVTAGDKEWVGDLLLSFSPLERFEMYVNATYRHTENGRIPAGLSGNSVFGQTSVDIDSTNGWGLATAGRFAVTERLGFAMRAEYVSISNFLPNNLTNPAFVPNAAVLLNGNNAFISDARDLAIWGLTGTVDYALAENLTVKVETRYDNVNQGTNQSSRNVLNPNSGSDIFLSGSNNQERENDQWSTGVEVIYAF
jgi:hypothetical protein